MVDICVVDITPHEGEQSCEGFDRGINEYCGTDSDWVVHHDKHPDVYLCADCCHGVDQFN